MSIDYIQLQKQVQALGENAILRASILGERRQIARQILEGNAQNQEGLRKKVLAASAKDRHLRCAIPPELPGCVPETLNGHFSAPVLPQKATLLAADGSQITPSHHDPVQFCLINVGAILLQLETNQPPVTSVQSDLLYDEQLYSQGGMITDTRLSLMRDLSERRRLAELAGAAQAPVISFTDGPLELWGAKDGESNFMESLQEYLSVLRQLNEMGVITAGYVDKPAADLVVRLLEIALQDEGENEWSRRASPLNLRGVIDRDLFHDLLAPGERSAVFGIQSSSTLHYRGELELHFFYLNVGRNDHPYMARVEIPAWVAQNSSMLGSLHAVLLQQCRIMGARPYPYLLHRAHEVAVVTLEEKEQVTNMISLELRRRGAAVGEFSNKQSAKDNPGRTRYER